MIWFKHKHRWAPVAVQHGVIGTFAPRHGTQVLQRCQDESCGEYFTQLVDGTWKLEQLREKGPDAEVEQLRRMVDL